MIYREIEQGTDEWHGLRRGRTTGTKAGKLYQEPSQTVKIAALLKEGKDPAEIIELAKTTKATVTKTVNKVEAEGYDEILRPDRPMMFYEIIAERIGIIDESGESGETGLSSGRDRGTDLEPEARERFAKESGKNVEEVTFITAEYNEEIGLSPDGIIDNGEGKYTEAVEIKCLSAANHLKAIYESRIPGKYMEQVYQYFVVMEDLEKLHFVFYDPRIAAKDFHVIEITRESVAEIVEDRKQYQIKTLKEIAELVDELTF